MDMAQARGWGEPLGLPQTLHPSLRGQVQGAGLHSPTSQCYHQFFPMEYERVSYSLALRKLWDGGSGRVGSSHSLGRDRRYPTQVDVPVS